MFFSKKPKTVSNVLTDFPLKNNNPDTIFLDNACTSLKPVQVIESITRYYTEFGSCALRSAHKLGQETTTEIDSARKEIAQYLGLSHSKEIIFTKGASDSINILSKSFKFFEDDEVIVSSLEHNSNLLPWISLAENSSVNIQIWNIDEKGGYDLGELETLLKRKQSKLLSLFSDSNIISVKLPLKEIIGLAHQNGVLVHLDASQSLLHRSLSFQDYDVDFMSFSFHKILGPTGIGVLSLKEKHYDRLRPVNLGGETVVNVSENAYVLSDPPHCYEAGIGSYAEIMGAAAAIRYLQDIGYNEIEQRDKELGIRLFDGLREIDKIKILGTGDPSHLVNFTLGDLDSGELSILLDKNYQIMARAGVHCGHYWYNRNKLGPSLRVSAAFYNDNNDIDQFISALKEIGQSFT